MKILITNNDLSIRAGTQLYVRDLAVALLRRGHSPFIYSPALGEIAKELRAATIPVVDDLDSLPTAPDVIHGQHHPETMTALLRFPGVPAVYFCHGWLPWEEAPPRFPRIRRYVAVDHASRDRLIFEHGIPEEKITVLLNFVDLDRFKPRGPLPPKPKRALVFSNYATEAGYLKVVRQACGEAGIKLDVAGLGVNNPSARPELLLGNYDLVFGKARAALEAMAVGAAVILCDRGKIGPMVTTSEFDRLRPLNFGIRVQQEPIHLKALTREIARYDPKDAALVSQRIRETASHETVVEKIISIYTEIIEENTGPYGQDELLAESRAAAAYLRSLSPRLKEYYALKKARAILLRDFLLKIPIARSWLKRRLIS